MLRIAFGLLLYLVVTSTAADLRVGMIGLDTSHAVEFTRRLNDSADKDYIPGARVVAAVKGGSPDIAESWDRMPKYTARLEKDYGVKIVDSIADLLPLVDVVMIESLDGRPHLAEAMPVIQAHKPLFVDKPVAGSLHDAIAIYQAAAENHVPIFSGSSLRYSANLQALKELNVGELRGASSCGPCALEPHHPDLFWYGIHPTEALYTIMGPGCQTVTCVATADTHLVTGIWNDGKIGTMRGIRNGAAPYIVTVFGSKKVSAHELDVNYTPFLREVVKFFQTGVAPVPPEQTLEIYAFMEAADESRQQGGCAVKLSDVMAKNR